MSNIQQVMPNYLSGYKGEGINIPVTEVTLPYLSLGQSTHKAVKESLVKYGEIYNSVTKKSFGVETDIVVVDFRIDWKEFDKSGQLLRTSSDGKTWSNGAAFTEEDSWKHKFYNYFVLIVKDESTVPYILSFAHTSAKTGKQLLNIIAQTTNLKGMPPFVMTYKLGVKKETSDGNEYMVWTIKQNDGWTDEVTCKKATEMKNFLAKNKVKTDDAPAAAEKDPF